MTEDTIKNLIKLTRDVDTSGNLTNDGLTVAYASNTYAASTFAGNTYASSTFTSNNSINTRLGGFASNNYVESTFVSNTFFQDNASSSVAPKSRSVYNAGQSGTYTVPAGVNAIGGFLVGGGGGGGGTHVQPTWNNWGGGGSGSGGAAFKVQFAASVSPGQTYSYAVGNAGAAGTNQSVNTVNSQTRYGGNGGAGGATYLGNLARSNGGNGAQRAYGGGGNVKTNSFGGNAGNITGNAIVGYWGGAQGINGRENYAGAPVPSISDPNWSFNNPTNPPTPLPISVGDYITGAGNSLGTITQDVNVNKFGYGGGGYGRMWMSSGTGGLNQQQLIRGNANNADAAGQLTEAVDFYRSGDIQSYYTRNGQSAGWSRGQVDTWPKPGGPGVLVIIEYGE